MFLVSLTVSSYAKRLAELFASIDSERGQQEDILTLRERADAEWDLLLDVAMSLTSDTEPIGINHAKKDFKHSFVLRYLATAEDLGVPASPSDEQTTWKRPLSEHEREFDEGMRGVMPGKGPGTSDPFAG